MNIQWNPTAFTCTDRGEEEGGGVKDRALEVLGTLQGNEEEDPMMGEYIGLMEARGYNALAN